jgi:predicted membrane-bound mannosyltransferase
LLVAVPLLWRRNGVGAVAVAVAMLLGATSPLAVYYARYFVQETMFVACFWASVPLLWRVLAGGNATSGKTKWACAFTGGIFLGLAVASKETWVLMAAAAAAGVVATVPSVKGIVGAWPQHLKWGGVFLGVGAAVSVAFFSSFGEKIGGVVDSVATYGNYIHKTSGGPHDKPFDWYFPLLFGVKPAIRELLSGAGALLVLALLPVKSAWGDGTERRIAAFSLTAGVVLFFLYSLISYKTPWLMLGVLPPLWLATGLALTALWRLALRRASWVNVPLALAALATIGLLIGAVFQWRAAGFLSRRLGSDERNPLAYVHTTVDVTRIESLTARLVPTTTEPLLVRSYATSYWPLPWYLRRWVGQGRVGFWPSVPSENADPLDAPIVLTDSETETAVAARLREKYEIDFLLLRPGVSLRMRVNSAILQRTLDAEAREEAAGGLVP